MLLNELTIASTFWNLILKKFLSFPMSSGLHRLALDFLSLQLVGTGRKVQSNRKLKLQESVFCFLKKQSKSFDTIFQSILTLFGTLKTLAEWWEKCLVCRIYKFDTLWHIVSMVTHEWSQRIFGRIISTGSRKQLAKMVTLVMLQHLADRVHEHSDWNEHTNGQRFPPPCVVKFFKVLFYNFFYDNCFNPWKMTVRLRWQRL